MTTGCLLCDTFVGTLILDETTHTLKLKERDTGRIVPLSFGDVLSNLAWEVTITPGQYRDKLISRGNKKGHVINIQDGTLEPLFLTELPAPYHLMGLLLGAYVGEELVTLTLDTPVVRVADLGTLGRLEAHNEQGRNKGRDSFSWRSFKTAANETLFLRQGDVLTILGPDGAAEDTITVDFRILRGMGPGFNNLPGNLPEWTTLYLAYREGKKVILKR